LGDSITKYFVAQKESRENPFLGVIAKLRNRLLASSSLSLSLSVLPHGTTLLSMEGFL